MPPLQVRDFPDELYVQLRDLAQREHRSLAQQTIVALREYLAHADCHQEKQQMQNKRQERIRHREEIFKRIDARRLPEIPLDFPSAVELVREDRDSL